MYEDNNNSIDWLKIILRVAIIILIFLLILKLIAIVMTNRREKNKENIMNNNLKLVQEKIKTSLNKDLVPDEIGEKTKYSLADLIKKDILIPVNDENGKECDRDKSFVEITKLESEVQIRVNLVCNDKEDFSNTFIESTVDKTTTTTKQSKKTTKATKDSKDIIPIKTTKKSTKKVTTTKKIVTTSKATTVVKTTTTSNSFIVSFNTNGGNYIEAQNVLKNNTAKYVKPVRDGYTFVGWYHNGTKFDFNAKITENIVLLAKWIKN